MNDPASAEAAHLPRRVSAGILYLVPTPLGPEDDPLRVLPRETIERLSAVDYLIAENARSARAVLGRVRLPRPLQSIEIRELNHRTDPQALPGLLEPIAAGRDGALLSEAGCPAVADPGAALVALAHAQGIRVVPLIGPSAILLALMASGMNGQRFAFAGYVPVADDDRVHRLRQLEQRSAQGDETQLLIETPYRNQALFDAMLRALSPTTSVAIATDITLPGERIETRRVADWAQRRPQLPKAPTVFALHAATVARAPRDRDPAGSARTARRRTPR